ncbi:sensor histidine kinase [Geobacter sp. SVR]|uniref:sensor histidine kinase n=1 Tax=Geobacter sp. SVR TaxID=2495594 RepID=UPI001EF38C7F|nr:ATP-binding protein [Geobacter sp. SVR]
MEFEARGEPQINGYPNEFSQALINILMNARDALQERGNGNGRIVVRSYSDNGRAVVTITDDAGGVDEEVMQKIFDAFFTTKPLGKGSGIGLFMSKNIIENNMGGSLTVRNTGMGAEFRIEV